MVRISEYSEAPYQGASQAPAQVRISTQASIVEDCALSIPMGVEKRSPFEFLCKLAGHPGQTNGSFELVESKGNSYALTLTQEAGVVVPRLYPLEGLPLAYSATGLASESIAIDADAQTYLDAAISPSLDFPIVTVEDTTFILNRRVVTKIQESSPGIPARSSARPYEALLWMRLAAYARTYRVTVSYGASTLTVTLRTPNGKDSTDGVDVDTDVIMRGLYDGTYPTGGTSAANGAYLSNQLDTLTGAGFTVTRQGSVIYLSHSSQDFTVEVSDGQGGSALTIIKDKVQAFADLPKKAVDGFIVRIGQQSGSEEDDFFVKFSETAGPGTGVWEETLGAGAELGLDKKKLPVGLINTAGTWTLEILDWQGRNVGDEVLAPDPDFVGRVLVDVTFWKGRVALLSSEGLTLSSSDDPFKLYPTTLSTVTAGDPVSLLNPFSQQAKFSYAIPFEQKLVLWGNRAQAQVTSQGVLTPDTAEIDEFSTFEYSPTSRPQGANNRLYFLSPRGTNYSSSFEVDITPSTSRVEGDDLSVQVPRYIPADVDRIANCPVNYQIVYGVSGATTLYPHLFRYAEKQRVQNAWSKWNLPAGFTYGGSFFINTYLYALLCRAGEAFLVRAALSPGTLDSDPSSRIQTRLDLRLTEEQVLRSYNSGTDTSTLVLPYPCTLLEQVSVAAPGGIGGQELSEGVLLDAPEGSEVEVLSVSGHDVVCRGDWTQAPLFVGTPFQKLVELTKFYARDPQGAPLRSGRLSLRTLSLDLDETAYLKVRVTVGARTPKEYIFEGALADDPQSTYGRISLYSGPWRIPLKGTNEATKIELINDSPFPSRVLGYTWEGELNLKATRGVK